MNVIRALIVIGIAGGGYTYWKQHVANHVPVEAGSTISESGFASLPPVDGQDSRTVFVVAAQNCPHEEAQRADRLAEDLSRSGIPVRRTDEVHFSFTGEPDSGTMERINRIMNGPLPIVFVDGRAKSNPSLDEVLAEFKGGRK